MPRQGISLTMQMLGYEGPTLFIDENGLPDTDNLKGFWEHESVKNLRNNYDWFAISKGRVVKIIHTLFPDLPSNYHYKIILLIGI